MFTDVYPYTEEDGFFYKVVGKVSLQIMKIYFVILKLCYI